VLLAGVICAFSAAPSLAIMVKLPNGRWANYDPMSGSKAPRAARILGLSDQVCVVRGE